MKRIILGVLAVVGGLVVLCLAMLVLLRDVPSGVYKPASNSDLNPDSNSWGNQSRQQWAEVSSVLPIMQLYGGNGVIGPRLLLVPVVNYALVPGFGVTRYERRGNGEVVFMYREAPNEPSKVLRHLDEDDPAVADIKAEWEADRSKMNAELLELEDVDISMSWRTSFAEGAFSAKFPAGYVVSQSDKSMFVHPEEHLGDRSRVLQVRAARQYESETFEDLEPRFMQRHPDATRLNNGLLVAWSEDGTWSLAGQRESNGTSVHIRGEATDIDDMKSFIGIVDSISFNSVAPELLSGDYIPASRPQGMPAIEDEWNQTVQGMIAEMLRPEALLESDSRFGMSPGVEVRVEGSGVSAYVQVGTLARKMRFPESEIRVVAENELLRVGIDESYRSCRVEYVLPIADHDEQDQLVMMISNNFLNLAHCQQLAWLLSRLDTKALQAIPEYTIAEELAPHALKYTDVILLDERIIVQDRQTVTMLTANGNELWSRQAQDFYLLWGGRWIQLVGDGKTGLVRQDGHELLPLEYGAIRQVELGGDHPDGQYAIVESEGRFGVFDVTNEDFVIPVSQDEVAYNPKWHLFRADDGETQQLFNIEGEPLIPSGFSEYIVGEPGRLVLSERDFIALHRSDGVWVFHTAAPQPLLQGEFRDVQLERRPADRWFHLTDMDGTQLTIDSRLELVEEGE